MMLRRSLLSLVLGLFFTATVSAQNQKQQDATKEALRDMQTGMAGLQQAGEDPALLAQLMQDMQVITTLVRCAREYTILSWITSS